MFESKLPSIKGSDEYFENIATDIKSRITFLALFGGEKQQKYVEDFISKGDVTEEEQLQFLKDTEYGIRGYIGSMEHDPEMGNRCIDMLYNQILFAMAYIMSHGSGTSQLAMLDALSFKSNTVELIMDKLMAVKNIVELIMTDEMERENARQNKTKRVSEEKDAEGSSSI